MNEFLFFFQILFVVGSVLVAYRMGGAMALTALIALQGVLANVFVVKQMNLFGLSATCSDVFAIGGILGLNLLQETWGRDEAARAVRISVAAMVFFAIVAKIHLLYLPSSFDRTGAAFETVLSSSPRIVIASLTVYYLVQQIDLRVFSFLKNWMGEKRLSVRVAISLLFSQLIDTVLFTFFGLYGLVESLFDVILISYLIKCLVIGSSSTFVALTKRWIRRIV